MKKLPLLLLLFISVSTFAQEWKKFNSEEFEFVASFPSEPNKTVQKVNTAVGVLDMNIFMVMPLKDDNVVYSVIRSDYPEEQFSDPSDTFVKSVLDGAVNGAVTNVNGKLLSDTKVTLRGYPGRSIKIEIPQAYLYVRAYLVKNTMYIVQVGCAKNKDKNASIDKFFKSFDITYKG